MFYKNKYPPKVPREKEMIENGTDVAEFSGASAEKKLEN